MTDLSPLAQRAIEAHDHATGLASAALDAQQARNAAVCALVAAGWTPRQVARLIDLSENRVRAIVKAADG